MAWSFSGQVARICLQGAYFVIVARVLGVDGFGAFATVPALVALALPIRLTPMLCTFWLKHVSTGSKSAAVQLSNGVLVTFIVGGAFIVFLVVAAPHCRTCRRSRNGR